RPRHRDLIKPQPNRGGFGVVDAEIVEGLAHIEIGFAGGDDAEARARAVDDDAVEPVGACEGLRRRQFIAVQPVLLVERRVRPAELPCFSGSPLRSTPGPLPYQIANTPSCLAPGNRRICCVPQTAVAASSSLIAGWNLIWLRSRKRRAPHSAWSKPPKGEPR